MTTTAPSSAPASTGWRRLQAHSPPVASTTPSRSGESSTVSAATGASTTWRASVSRRPGIERTHHAMRTRAATASTADEAAAIRGQKFDFYDWAPGEVRLVTSWDQDMAAVAALATAIRAL